MFTYMMKANSTYRNMLLETEIQDKMVIFYSFNVVSIPPCHRAQLWFHVEKETCGVLRVRYFIIPHSPFSLNTLQINLQLKLAPSEKHCFIFSVNFETIMRVI